MKFFLTIYICSQLTGVCVIPPGYPKSIADYYSCNKAGMGEAYAIMFGEKALIEEESITRNRLYPKYTCEEVIVPKKKPKSKQPETEYNL
jgi:hypothetical protein